tara:strand:- start:207 stop:410 length:204 start_codon:yes stop_codon:yes gene_type:complete
MNLEIHYTDEGESIADAECPNCSRMVVPCDLVDWQVSRQTMSEPAEYQDGCIYCGPQETHDPREDAY